MAECHLVSVVIEGFPSVVSSPPSVSVQAREFGLKEGETWDLPTVWDLCRAAHRREAEDYVDKENQSSS